MGAQAAEDRRIRELRAALARGVAGPAKQARKVIRSRMRELERLERSRDLRERLEQKALEDPEGIWGELLEARKAAR